MLIYRMALSNRVLASLGKENTLSGKSTRAGVMERSKSFKILKDLVGSYEDLMNPAHGTLFAYVTFTDVMPRICGRLMYFTRTHWTERNAGLRV